MFLPLILIQMFLIRTGWWVYYNYTTQPKYNHPMIFWNPLMRLALVVGPTACAILLVVFAFHQNIHPWWFLLFSIGWWIYGSKLHKPKDDLFLMQTLTEDGIRMENFSKEEILDDIRAWNNESSQNKNNDTED